MVVEFPFEVDEAVCFGGGGPVDMLLASEGGELESRRGYRVAGWSFRESRCVAEETWR